MAIADIQRNRKLRETGQLTNDRKEEELKERHDFLVKLNQSYLKAGVPQAYINEDVDQMSLQVKSFEKIGFTREIAAVIFIEHRYFSRKVLAEKYGLELLYWGDKDKPANMIQRIYNDVVKRPEQFAELIDQDTIDDIIRCVQYRVITQDSTPLDGQVQLRSVKHIIAKPIEDMGNKLEALHKKAVNMLESKIDTIKTRKDLGKEDLLKIANVAKITGDQARLASGQATQHIAHVVHNELDGKSTEALIRILAEQRQAQNEMNQ